MSFKSMINGIKLAVIKFNSSRTMPYDLKYFNEAYWSECYPTLSDNKFISEINGKKYRYKWRKYEQSKWGIWVALDSYLSTDKNYRP